MLQAKPSLQEDLTGKSAAEKAASAARHGVSAGPSAQLLKAEARQRPAGGFVLPAKVSPATLKENKIENFQARVPVIIGEATFTGTLPVDGVIGGQVGTSGGTLAVRQRTKSTLFGKGPELNGALTFKDMLRVNGHIAGQVRSPKGTLIVDSVARVDADVEVAVAVIGGTVNGDIIAHQRVELGPEARINGNIWTQSIAIQPGAIFEGVCRMLQDEKPGE